MADSTTQAQGAWLAALLAHHAGAGPSDAIVAAIAEPSGAVTLHAQGDAALLRAIAIKLLSDLRDAGGSDLHFTAYCAALEALGREGFTA